MSLLCSYATNIFSQSKSFVIIQTNKKMKIINKLVFTALLSVIIISCNKNDDNTYFNGEIRQIEDKVENEKKVVLTPLQLQGVNYGFIAVYDSLMFFMNPKLPDQFFNLFNVDTGKEIGTFHNKGQGPNEFIGLSPIFQFYIDDDDDELKTLLFAPNEDKLLIWNISKTVKQRKTMIDTIVPYTWNEETKGASYKYIFRLNKDKILTSVQSHMTINDKMASLPFYQKRTIFSNELLKNYSIYKQAIRNDEAEIIPETFFASNEFLKPDGSKIVQAMLHLSQLNIMDIATGEVVGYRMKGSPNFSIFTKKNKPLNKYHTRIQADDNYIYAAYWGKGQWGRYDIPFVNTIHVFDWYGNLIQRIITDQPVGEMTLDAVRNRLYTTDVGTDEVFYLELDGLVD